MTNERQISLLGVWFSRQVKTSRQHGMDGKGSKVNCIHIGLLALGTKLENWATKLESSANGQKSHYFLHTCTYVYSTCNTAHWTLFSSLYAIMYSVLVTTHAHETLTLTVEESLLKALWLDDTQVRNVR